MAAMRAFRFQCSKLAPKKRAEWLSKDSEMVKAKTPQEFLEELAIKPIDRLLFSGTPNQWPNRHVFGGHVIGQSMEAAQKTVPPEFHVHSMHAYFLRPGNADLPIIYEVDPIRDGRSFLTRRVVAIQNGEPIFNSSVSFHIGEIGLEHQRPATAITISEDGVGPEDVDPDELYLDRIAEEAGIKVPMAKLIPFNQRTIDRQDLLAPRNLDPLHGLWMKLDVNLPDDPALHTRLLAFMSDSNLIGSALRPHGITWLHPDLKMMTSLDHCFYMHEPKARADQWIFYQVEGIWAGHGRVYGRGNMYTRDGKLIASANQEGLVRLTEDAKIRRSKG